MDLLLEKVRGKRQGILRAPGTSGAQPRCLTPQTALAHPDATPDVTLTGSCSVSCGRSRPLRHSCTQRLLHSAGGEKRNSVCVITPGRAHGVTQCHQPAGPASPWSPQPHRPNPQGSFLVMAMTRDKLLTQEPPSPHSSSASFSPWHSWSIQRDPTAGGPGALQVQGADSGTSYKEGIHVPTPDAPTPAPEWAQGSCHRPKSPPEPGWAPKINQEFPAVPRQEKSEQFTHN